jgi:hypothetical protein
VSGEISLRAGAVGPLDRIDAKLDERPTVEDLPLDDLLSQVLDAKLAATRIGPGG